MPIHGYSGGVISATSPTVSPTSASGVWTLDDQLQNAANWPSQSNIARSLRFNSADSAYLNRTPGSAGNSKTFTWAGWVKRSGLGATNFTFFAARDAVTPADNYIRFTDDSGGDKIRIVIAGSNLQTTAVYRDPSSWYHIVVAVDTTQATSSNRIKLYVNGVQVTDFSTSTYPSQNVDALFNNTSYANYIGVQTTSNYFSGYMADVYFIDGQALTPSSFGYTDSNGIWQPMSYTGTYGTNGFWLNFDDNSNTTAATLGKDSSGNGNNWTPNNFSVTAGAGNDSLVDSPTNYGTDTGVGGEVRGNYAVMNPVDRNASYPIGLANGNLQITTAVSGGTYYNGRATISPKAKTYIEFKLDGANDYFAFGLQVDSEAVIGNNYVGSTSGSYSINQLGFSDYRLSNNASSTTTSVTKASGDTFQMAFDPDTGKVWFGVNGTWVNSGNPSTGANPAYTLSTSSSYLVAISNRDSAAGYVNFGQRPFAYTAPAGFKALCSTNLPTPTIQKGADYFNTGLWTGNTSASNIAVTGIGFKPDFFWGKLRSAATGHRLIDSIRGVTKILNSNGTGAESTETDAFASFDTDGFTIGKDTTGGGLNYNTNTGVGWVWKGGGTGVTNTAGSITSTVSANQTAGFSVVTWTGASGSQTVGHGLGASPAFMIWKTRNVAQVWYVYHQSLGTGQYLTLNGTGAASLSSGIWGTINSSTFTQTSATFINPSETVVSYCFAPVSGYSAFGSYTANASTDGPFIYTGFRPKFVILKDTTRAVQWVMFDSARNTYNIANSYLLPSSSNAEASTTVEGLDFVSNGIKIRGVSTSYNNHTSGDTYIYAAFAENPFKIARAR